MFSIELPRNSDEVAQIMSGPVDCTETSVRNYHYTLRNIPEDCRSQGDKITTVTLKNYNSGTFPFQKGTRQAPYIFMKPVCPLTSPLQPTHRLTSYKNRVRLKVISRL